MSKKLRNWFIVLGVIILFFIVCLYFYKFNGILSDNQSDWAAFGNYIGGIAALVNVGVFVWLTLAIKAAGDVERKKERNHQRRIIIMQMRQDELKNLISSLNDATSIELGSLQGLKMLNAAGYVLAFAQCSKKLFPLLEDETFFQKMIDIHSVLTRMRIISMRCAGFDENGKFTSAIKPLPSEFNDANKEFQELKVTIISQLEEYVIDNINEEKSG